MSWNNSSLGGRLKAFQSLRALEPSRMVTTFISVPNYFSKGKEDKPCEPSLRNPISPILNHVAMVANEEESTTVWEVKLHPNKSIGVSGEVVE